MSKVRTLNTIIYDDELVKQIRSLARSAKPKKLLYGSNLSDSFIGGYNQAIADYTENLKKRGF